MPGLSSERDGSSSTPAGTPTPRARVTRTNISTAVTNPRVRHSLRQHQQKMKPLGPAFLEYQYYLAREELAHQVIRAAFQLGYNPPPPRATPKQIAESELTKPTTDEIHDACIPAVERACRWVDEADVALNAALADGQTWENTPWPEHDGNPYYFTEDWEFVDRRDVPDKGEVPFIRRPERNEPVEESDDEVTAAASVSSDAHTCVAPEAPSEGKGKAVDKGKGKEVAPDDYSRNLTPLSDASEPAHVSHASIVPVKGYAYQLKERISANGKRLGRPPNVKRRKAAAEADDAAVRPREGLRSTSERSTKRRRQQ